MRDFDELLEGVLRDIAEPEPRGGLECRVLAGVHGERGVVALSAWRRWAWALVPVAASAGLVLAVRNSSYRSAVAPVEIRARATTGAGNEQLIAKAADSSARDRKTDLVRSRGEQTRYNGTPWSDRSEGLSGPRQGAAGRALDGLPKLAKFPAVAQNGSIAGWLAIASLPTATGHISPEALQALEELKSSQTEPIRIAVIDIPLLRRTEVDDRQGDVQ